MQKVSFPVCNETDHKYKTGNRIAESAKNSSDTQRNKIVVHEWRKVRQPQRCSHRHIFLRADSLTHKLSEGKVAGGDRISTSAVLAPL